MKTITINNKDFTFETAFAQRISDDPKYGYARVLVYLGNNNIEQLKEWYINFQTRYIDLNTMEEIEEMCHFTKNEGQQWKVHNQRKVVVRDVNGNPVANPNYDPEQEESPENLPHLWELQYDRYSSFLFNENLNFNPLPVVMRTAIMIDDANGYFNSKKPDGSDW